MTTLKAAARSPPEVDSAVQPLLYALDDEFEAGIQSLEVRELLKLISCLQQEMALEQQRFDHLSRALNDRRGDGWDEAGPIALSSSLCQSQIRLAQLCNRNMRCFTQQAARAQQGRTLSLQRQNNNTASSEQATITKDHVLKKVQCSSLRENQPPSPSLHAPASATFSPIPRKSYDDRDRGGPLRHDGPFDVSMKVRAPSVEDILKNVRALRQEMDERGAGGSPDLDSAKPRQQLTSGGHESPMRQTYQGDIVKSAEAGNEYDLVPTATQLLLRTKPSNPKSPLLGYVSENDARNNENKVDAEQHHPEQNDSLCSYTSSDANHMPEIRRSNLSCPNLLSDLSLREADELDPSLNSWNKCLVNDEEDDDEDSGVGADERPKSGSRRRRQLGDEALYQRLSSPAPPPPTLPASSKVRPSAVHAPASQSSALYNNNNNGVSLKTELPDQFCDFKDDEIIPSIIDQFMSHPLPEAEAFRRQKGSNVRWNPDRLLEELYRIPTPTAMAAPPATFLNMEGYLEKLPSGRRQGTFWNAWKRRYFRLKDGYLNCYLNAKSEEPNFSMQLMGGKVDTVDTTMFGIDDGKGHYVVVRCGNRAETERWRRALITHTAENYSLTYAQPVVPYPQFYEDVLIIDIGSCSLRAGILCNQPTLPQVYFPTVCAKDRASGNTVYGKEALLPVSRFGASVTFPLRPSAKITKFTVDLQAVRGLLSKVFYELNVDPSDYQIQLSLPRSFPFQSQTEVLDLLMTEFSVRAVNLTAQTVLALCSYNNTSGVVVDIGERLEVIPIVDGYVIESGVSRIPYGGTRLLDHLRHFLMQHHYGLASETESFLLRYVLECGCYCAEHYNKELQRFYSDPQSFEMAVPVGQFFEGDAPWDVITLDSGRFQAPEGLFNPDAWGLDNPGVHKLVSKAIQECSVDVRKEMSRSIYLSGGVTTLPGFAERLQSELDQLTPPTIFPKVHASPYRAHAAYLGACILAASTGFHQAKVTRDDWIASGSSCLKKWHF